MASISSSVSSSGCNSPVIGPNDVVVVVGGGGGGGGGGGNNGGGSGVGSGLRPRNQSLNTYFAGVNASGHQRASSETKKVGIHGAAPQQPMPRQHSSSSTVSEDLNVVPVGVVQSVLKKGPNVIAPAPPSKVFKKQYTADVEEAASVRDMDLNVGGVSGGGVEKCETGSEPGEIDSVGEMKIQKAPFNKPIKKALIVDVVRQTPSGTQSKDFVSLCSRHFCNQDIPFTNTRIWFFFFFFFCHSSYTNFQVYVMRVSYIGTPENTFTLIRHTFEDFFDFHLQLIGHFPEESGLQVRPNRNNNNNNNETHSTSTTTPTRIIPELPAQMMFVSEAVAKSRVGPLQDYIKNILALPPKISRSPVTMQFLRQDGKHAATGNSPQPISPHYHAHYHQYHHHSHHHHQVGHHGLYKSGANASGYSSAVGSTAPSRAESICSIGSIS
jgi:hypothetical protein